MSDERNYDVRLKPCPFCGSPAYLGFYVDGVDNYVYCSQCWVAGSDNFNGEQAAIDAWNKRHQDETDLARIKELETLISEQKSEIRILKNELLLQALRIKK